MLCLQWAQWNTLLNSEKLKVRPNVVSSAKAKNTKSLNPFMLFVQQKNTPSPAYMDEPLSCLFHSWAGLTLQNIYRNRFRFLFLDDIWDMMQF